MDFIKTKLQNYMSTSCIFSLLHEDGFFACLMDIHSSQFLNIDIWHGSRALIIVLKTSCHNLNILYDLSDSMKSREVDY